MENPVGSEGELTFGAQQREDEASVLPSLGAQVLCLLLSYDHSLLSIRELGRLSVCSHQLSTILDDATIWKKVFDTAAQAGKKFCKDESVPFHDTHARHSWNGENGLLTCFSNPKEKVISKVGYKRAAGCLLGKSCNRCGKMGSNANPLTMMRVCQPCAEVDEASFLINKSKAKEAFLLGEKDIKNLPSASYESTTISGKDCISTLLLMSDVKEASYSKYGGADGLAAEFTKRTSAAVERYTKSQSTTKPQKKRPKIEKMSARPGENLQQLAFWRFSLPIGTAFMHSPWFRRASGEAPQLKMDKPVTCNVCNQMGLCSDVIMHERLEHGIDMILRGVEPQPRHEPEDLSKLEEVPGVTEELIELLANTNIVCTTEKELMVGLFGGHGLARNCLISINSLQTASGDNRDQITVCVDECRQYSDECEAGRFTICYQLTSQGVPFKLLKLGLGEFCDDNMEASTYRFQDLIQALGLTQTNPAQLLVTLMSRAMRLDHAQEMLSGLTEAHYSSSPRKEMPVVYAACDILKKAE